VKLVKCYRCNVQFGMTDDFHNMAVTRGEAFTWYCPNGHAQVFTARESEEDKLRRERDRLRQSVAEWQDAEREQRERAQLAERRASAARGQVTKLKNRASKGICPCCNRTFTNLQRHMATKHPTFISEPDEASHVH